MGREGDIRNFLRKDEPPALSGSSRGRARVIHSGVVGIQA